MYVMFGAQSYDIGFSEHDTTITTFEASTMSDITWIYFHIRFLNTHINGTTKSNLICILQSALRVKYR
jgi:hypothetical protein